MAVLHGKKNRVSRQVQFPMVGRNFHILENRFPSREEMWFSLGTWSRFRNAVLEICNVVFKHEVIVNWEIGTWELGTCVSDSFAMSKKSYWYEK